MAERRTNQLPDGIEPLFVSPERLVLDGHGGDLNNAFHQHQQQAEDVQQQSHHHHTVWAAQDQPHPHQQRPSLPLHTMSEWSFPRQSTALPPTPISPFRPLRPLSEDEKLAFPCTGDAYSCWNLDLCPKHRQDHPAEPQQRQPTPKFNHGRSMSAAHIPQMPPNPRRRSAPTTDLEPPPAKMKRNHTEPEEHDPEYRARPSQPSRGRVPHNLVERRYRDNLNNQIEALRLTLPSLKDAVPCTDLSLEDTSSPRMPSKAVIISTAATYIKDMENERLRLLAANQALQEQVSGLRKLVRCDDCSIMQYLGGVNLAAVGLPTPS